MIIDGQMIQNAFALANGRQADGRFKNLPFQKVPHLGYRERVRFGQRIFISRGELIVLKRDISEYAEKAWEKTGEEAERILQEEMDKVAQRIVLRR